MNKLNNDELGFERVRELVAHYAITPEAKQVLTSMRLKTSLNAVNLLLNETGEMLEILKQEPPVYLCFGRAKTCNDITGWNF